MPRSTRQATHARDPTARPAPETLHPVIKELLILLGAFVGATLVAELLGAVNTGTALTFGQLGIAAAFTWIVISRP